MFYQNLPINQQATIECEVLDYQEAHNLSTLTNISVESIDHFSGVATIKLSNPSTIFTYTFRVTKTGQLLEI